MATNTMQYRGYTASVSYSAEDEALVGRVLGINDVIGFHGDSVKEARASFKETIDTYLAHCKKAGKKPERQCNGKILLRVDPSVHSKLFLEAEKQGTSLNEFIVNKLVGNKRA